MNAFKTELHELVARHVAVVPDGFSVAAIRERDAACNRVAIDTDMGMQQAFDALLDRRALLAHVDALAAENKRLEARLAEAERILRRLRFLRVECITHKDNELMDDWREFLRPADSASAQEDIGQ